MTRIDPHEPTPEEVLEYIADFIGDNPQPESLTLSNLRIAVACRMAMADEYFTSVYRHADGGLHESVYRILGGTVSLNDQIAIIRQNYVEKVTA